MVAAKTHAREGNSDRGPQHLLNSLTELYTNLVKHKNNSMTDGSKRSDVEHNITSSDVMENLPLKNEILAEN